MIKIFAIYGIFSSLEPGEIRYVGMTEHQLEHRLQGHTQRCYRDHDDFAVWGKDVMSRGGSIEIKNLTIIEDLTEREWATRLKNEGHRLFNQQLVGGQGRILRDAWQDPSKRKNMSAHHEQLHAKMRKENPASSARSKVAISWGKKNNERSQDMRQKISNTLSGRKLGKYTDERNYYISRMNRLQHRERKQGPFSADIAWLRLLNDVIKQGQEASPRGKNTLELLSSLTVVDMTRPVVTIAERKLGYRFMCAEAAWIMSGDNRVETISPYSKAISNFSDDGKIFFGAYGPKFKEQVEYVVSSLRKDPTTRQAVFNIWRENPPENTKDFPCTLSCQLMIRDGHLDSFVTMRSNDVWLGTCYDIFNACMWSAYVLLEIKMPEIKLGHLFHTATSRHLYESNYEQAKICLDKMTIGFQYTPFDPYEFSFGWELTKHLESLAKKEAVSHAWLKELSNL